MAPQREIPAFESFEATIVSYDDRPDECTIRPRDVSEERVTTAWITAKEGSFCRPSDRV